MCDEKSEGNVLNFQDKVKEKEEKKDGMEAKIDTVYHKLVNLIEKEIIPLFGVRVDVSLIVTAPEDNHTGIMISNHTIEDLLYAIKELSKGEI